MKDPVIGPADRPTEEERTLRRLPLFPLTDDVHFPHTEIELHVRDSHYSALAEDLFLARGRESWIGTVLLRPGFRIETALQAPVFDEGTAGRLIDVREERDGCHLVVRGERRFRVERETAGATCREGWVRFLAESQLSERDPDVQDLRRELLSTTTLLAGEIGEDWEHLLELDGGLPFEALVNQLAAHVDVDPVKKLQLLRDSLPERALRLLTILRNRRQVLELLRPYRHLAADPDRN